MAARTESHSHQHRSATRAEAAGGGSVADPATPQDVADPAIPRDVADPATPQDPDNLYEVRLAKLEAIERAGIDPFPARYPRTHTLREALEQFPELDGYDVRVAGRIDGAKRVMGKAAFTHLKDWTGRLQ